MATMGAMASTPPRLTTNSAMARVSSTPRRGLPSSPCPFAKGRAAGKMSSAASACRMRGAPMNEASADDNVAATMPTVISTGSQATRPMASKSATSSVLSWDPAKTTAAAKYTAMDTPTARNVPSGRLLPASSRSPLMLTPWVKPVTAGKYSANSTQKPVPCSAGSSQLRASVSPENEPRPPTKNEISPRPSAAMTTYCRRVAQSDPSQANTNSTSVAPAAMTRASGPPGSSSATASPKPST